MNSVRVQFTFDWPRYYFLNRLQAISLPTRHPTPTPINEPSKHAPTFHNLCCGNIGRSGDIGNGFKKL